MPIDPLKELPGYVLRRASAVALAGLLERLEALDLRTAEASVLVVINANRQITQSAIGRMLSIASANLAPLVARLEERRLIERARIDGRSQNLRLTRAGRALANRALAQMLAHEDALLRRVPIHLHQPLLQALQALWSPDTASEAPSD